MTEPQHVRDLFSAIEDLIDTVTEDIKELPESVKLSIAFANFAVIRAKIEGDKT